MRQISTGELAKLLKAEDLPVRVDEYGTIFVDQEPISAFIVQRPHYCDRGRWQVNAESIDPTRLSIDWADGFPRYYFHADCLVKEFSHWFKLRLAGRYTGTPDNGVCQSVNR